MTDDDDWRQVTETELVAGSVLSRLQANGLELDVSLVVQLMLIEPSTAPYLRIEAAAPSRSELRQLVPHTRLFFNRPRANDLGWDAVALAAATAATGSVTLSSAATLMQRLVRTFRVLGDLEYDLVMVLITYSGGRPYDVAVPESTIIDAYDGRTQLVRTLLTSMRRRGILTSTNGDWLLVR